MKKVVLLMLISLIFACGDKIVYPKPDCFEDDDCKFKLCHTAICEDMKCIYTLVDSDGDGFSRWECGGDDCDDANETTNPATSEICGDYTDNDCDGVVDNGC